MIALFKRWYQRHFSQPGTIEFALVLIGVFVIVYYLMWLLGPIVVALCLAYCLDWCVRALTRHLRLARVWSAALTMLLFISVLLGILVFVAPKVLQQGSEFYNKVQQYSQNAIERGEGEDETLDQSVAASIYEVIVELPDPISSMITVEEIEEMVYNARSELMTNLTQIIRTQIMPSVVNVATWLMYMIVVPILTFLMLSNKETLQRRLRVYILPHNQELLRVFWPRINSQIENYIRGKLIHISLITLVNTITFMSFVLNYAFLLGFGVGLSVIIPYVGLVIITIPVVLIALFQFGPGAVFAWLMAVYVVIQVLDGNVLTPLLFSKAMNLDAISILVAVLIFGGLWGFWGVFFSIPLATFISTLLVHWPSTDKREDKTRPRPATPARRGGAGRAS